MLPLRRSLSLSAELSSGARDVPLTVSTTSPLRMVMSHLQEEFFSHPPSHNSAGLFTIFTVEEGVSGPTDIHGTQPDP